MKSKLITESEGKTLIEITSKNDPSVTIASFFLLEKVTKETWQKAANRAKLSSIQKLQEWGKAYGRLFGKYLIDNRKEPEHVSENCVVVFGTELVEYGASKVEQEIALKFLSDDSAFENELKNREKIIAATQDASLDAENHVLLVKAAFTNKFKFANLKTSCGKVKYQPGLPDEVANYKHIKIDSVNEVNAHKPICHILVMKCGQDLSDISSRRNIAGKNVDEVLNATMSAAKTLQFLNETCGIMHGNVKARNFLRLDDEGGYFAIDLSKAGDIQKMEIVKSQPSSGYLPPEHAAKVYDRLVETKNDKTNVKIKRATEPKEITANIQYDMWCFGVMTYQLCTGEQLFDMDNHEEVDNDEMKRIKDCTSKMIDLKLRFVSKDAKWAPLKFMLEKVLQPDPLDRPKSWKEILDIFYMSDIAIQELRIEALLRKVATATGGDADNKKMINLLEAAVEDKDGVSPDTEYNITVHSNPLEMH